MAVKFKKQYTNEAEYMLDLAKSSELFNENTYKSFDTEDAIDYTYVIAGTLNKKAENFDWSDYSVLSPEMQYAYISNAYYGDTSSDEYKEANNAFKALADQARADQTYNSLNTFEKIITTTTGIVGSAATDLFLGTTEGLIDVFGFLGGEKGKDFIAKDLLGNQQVKNYWADYNKKYTAIGRNKIVNVINDVTSGLTQMAPLLIPYAGAPIYYLSMAGRTAEETVLEKPDIDYGSLLAYTALTTGTEIAIEKLSGKLLGRGTAVDNLFSKTGSKTASSWVSHIGMDFLSEGLEESISEFTNSVFHSTIVNKNMPFDEVDIGDVLYAGLIGGITGGVAAGIRAGTHTKMTLLADGSVITTSEYKQRVKAGEKLTGKNLSRIQSLNLTEAIQEAGELLNQDTNEDKLIKKYSKKGLSISDIKTKHKAEYDAAVEEDVARQDELVKASMALNKILEIAGPEKFKKAVKIANYTAEQKQQAIDNYRNHYNSLIGLTLKQKNIASQYEKKRGKTLNIKNDLNVIERNIQDKFAKDYDMTVVFGNIGSADGVTASQNDQAFLLDDNTLILDAELSNTMSLDAILDKVVKLELARSLQYKSGILTPKNVELIKRKYLELKLKKNIDTALDSRDEARQAESLAQVLLFDRLTVSRIFACDRKNIFNKVWNWLINQREIIKKDVNKSRKNQIKYNTLLKTIRMYQKSIADRIGKGDLAAVAELYQLSDREVDYVRNNIVETYSNSHYTLMKIKPSFISERKHEAEKLLEVSRPKINQKLPLNYDNIFNPEYYTREFVDAVNSTGVEGRGFRYNLQKYMIDNYDVVINDRTGSIMQTVNLDPFTTKEFKQAVEDAVDNPYMLFGYETLADIFNKKFVKKFNTADGSNDLSTTSIVVNLDDTNKKIMAEYNSKDRTITIYPKNITNADALLHAIYHEATHAISLSQGLPNGTSTRIVKQMLVDSAKADDIDFLAKTLLNTDSYAELSGNKTKLLDTLAYGIYRITDGEYSAEAYRGSLVRGGQSETELKGGFLMNESGFTTDDKNNLKGYGIFSGIYLHTTRKVTEQTGSISADNLTPFENYIYRSSAETEGDVDTSALRSVEEVTKHTVSDNRKKIMPFLESKGLTTDDFTQEFMQDIAAGNVSDNDLYLLLHTKKVGNKKAQNALIEFLSDGKNKNIKTVKDLDNAKTFMASALMYHTYNNDRIKRGKTPLPKNPNIKRINYVLDELRKTDLFKFITDKKGVRHYVIQLNDIVTGQVTNLDSVNTLATYLLEDKGNASGVEKWLIEHDFDFSETKVKEFYRRLKNRSLGIVKSETGLEGNSKNKKGDEITQDYSDAQQFKESPDPVAEQYEKDLEGPEKEDAQVAAILKKIAKSKDPVEQHRLREQILELDYLEELAKKDEHFKEMLDLAEKSKLSPEGFALRERMARGSDNLKKILGADKYKLALEIAPDTKQHYEEKINGYKKLIEGRELDKKDQKVMNEDVSKFTTPEEYETYLIRLQNVLLPAKVKKQFITEINSLKDELKNKELSKTDTTVVERNIDSYYKPDEFEGYIKRLNDIKTKHERMSRTVKKAQQAVSEKVKKVTTEPKAPVEQKSMEELRKEATQQVTDSKKKVTQVDETKVTTIAEGVKSRKDVSHETKEESRAGQSGLNAEVGDIVKTTGYKNGSIPNGTYVEVKDFTSYKAGSTKNANKSKPRVQYLKGNVVEIDADGNRVVGKPITVRSDATTIVEDIEAPKKVDTTSKKVDTTPKKVDTISTQDVAGKVEFTKTQTDVAKNLINIMPADFTESEYQGDIDKESNVYIEAKYSTVNANREFFESIKPDDLENILKALSIQDDPRADAAYNLLLRYAYDHTKSQFKKVKDFVVKKHKRIETNAAQAMAGARHSYGHTRTVHKFITELNVTQGANYKIPDDVLLKFAENTHLKARVSQLETEITSLLNQLADAKNEVEKAKLNERISNLEQEKVKSKISSMDDYVAYLQSRIDELEAAKNATEDSFDKWEIRDEINTLESLSNAIEDGDVADALDILNEYTMYDGTNYSEALNASGEMFESVVEYIIKNPQQLGIAVPPGTDVKLLPDNVKQKITDTLKTITSYKYIAMLSNPVTGLRNGVINTANAICDKVAMKIMGKVENVNLLRAASQVAYNGDYDAEFSSYVDSVYRGFVRASVQGDKYYSNEMDRLQQEYAEKTDPIHKNKVLSKIQELERKMLNDAPWTSRKSMDYLKSTLAGSSGVLLNDSLTKLKTMYRSKLNNNPTVEEIISVVNKTNPDLAKLIKNASAGNKTSILKLAQQMKIDKVSTDTSNKMSIVTHSIYRSNKLFFKADNAITRNLSKLRKSHPGIAFAIETVIPFARNAVNTGLYVAERSPIGLVQGIYKMFQTKAVYLSDMKAGVMQYYKDTYVKENRDKIFKQSEFDKWFETNAPTNVKEALSNGGQLLSNLFNNLAAQQLIDPSLVGANNPFMRAQAIEKLTNGALGTTAMVLGFILSSVLDVFDYDDDEDYLGAVIKVGNLKISLEDLSPVSTMFTVGAMLGSGNVDKGVDAALKVFINSTIFSVVDSFLSYSNDFKSLIENQFINMLGQYIPAITKNARKSFGAKKDKSGNFPEKLIKTLAGQTISFGWLVPNKINPYTGEPYKYYESGLMESIFFGLISPIDMRYANKSDLQKTAELLKAGTTGFSGSFSINGNDYVVSGKDKEKLSKERAKYINEQYQLMVSGSVKISTEDENGKKVETTWNKLTNEQKARALKNLYTKGTEIAKIKYWTDKGNYYVATTKKQYSDYYNMFGSQIIYRTSWSKSKYVEG